MTPRVLDNLDFMLPLRVHKVMTIRVMGISVGHELPQVLDFAALSFLRRLPPGGKGLRL